MANWNNGKHIVYSTNVSTVLLNEYKTERYVSVLNRKYGDKEFCALITNEIIIAVLCINNKKPSPMKIIFLSLFI